MGSLDGKVALITGAGRGQGRAHAHTLAREGADIIGIDVDANKSTVTSGLSTRADLEETAKGVEALGHRVLIHIADVREQQQLDEAVARGIAEFGRIDLLIANAGILTQANFWEMTEETWQDMLSVNLSGVWRTAKAVAPHMISRQSGAIVLTSSVNGFTAGDQMAHYVSGKHGVIGLMRSIANELARYGIRCNAVCPGAIDTPMINTEANYARFAGKPHGTRDDAWESVRHYHLLKGRSMLPAEAVSEGALWLLSDATQHVTGVALPIDAGNMVLPGYNPNPVI